jgi:dTDP-D-glucose 4,6-dehydratase
MNDPATAPRTVSGTTLITGGAGFIGTNLVRQFAAQTDERLLVLDKLTYAGDLTGIGPMVEEGRIMSPTDQVTTAVTPSTQQRWMP